MHVWKKREKKGVEKEKKLPKNDNKNEKHAQEQNKAKKMETETHMCTCRGALWESCFYKLIGDLRLLFSIDDLLLR